MGHLEGTCNPDTCYSCRVLSVGIAASAMPTRSPECVETARSEKVLVKDRTAFKQMRDDGMQPAKMHGAADLQRHAESKWEVESGKILPPQVRDRAVEAHEFIAKSGVPDL